MSMTTGSALGSSTAPAETADSARRAPAKAEGKAVAVAAGGSLLGDAASATVSWSEEALDAVENGVEAVAHGVGEAVAGTYHALGSGVRSVADGVEHAASSTWNWVAGGVASGIDEIETLAHAALGSAPAAVISATGSAIATAIEGTAGIAGEALSLVALGTDGGVKVLGALV